MSDPVRGTFQKPCQGPNTLDTLLGQQFNCPRYDAYGNITHYHLGKDVSSVDQTEIPLYASHRGPAIYIRTNSWAYRQRGYYDLSAGGYGNHIIQDSKQGWASMYCHFSRIVVPMGKMLEKGELMGYMGETGYAMGIHAHIELILRYPEPALGIYKGTKDRVDPTLYWGTAEPGLDLRTEDETVAGFITYVGAQKKTWLATANTRRYMESEEERKDLAKVLGISSEATFVAPETFRRLKEIK